MLTHPGVGVCVLQTGNGEVSLLSGARKSLPEETVLSDEGVSEKIMCYRIQLNPLSEAPTNHVPWNGCGVV